METSMGNANDDLAQAQALPDGDVIKVLLQQHARIRELFADITTANGEHKKQAFDELRALLAAHETAEEMVLRPVSKKVAGNDIVDAVNAEERAANGVLADLEKMDVDSPEFDRMLADFRQSVDAHAEHEERDEFPQVLSWEDTDERRSMGRKLLAAERIAPTHPHPSTAGKPAAQWAVGPFVSLVDRARDAVSHG
jgi:hemerythrin superfamily protein